MKEYWQLINKLKEIKKSGYVKTHRAGDTGIGKTLEDLLGIEENNIPGPNGRLIELKSARKNAKSMLGSEKEYGRFCKYKMQVSM